MLRTIRLFFLWLWEIIRGSRPPRRAVSEIERPFYVIGHRGAPCRYAENTIESFEEAVDTIGVNALELDLCMTKDGEIVVWHDWDPDDTITHIREQGGEPEVRFCCSIPNTGTYRRHIHELMLEDFRCHYGYIEKGEEECAPVHIPTFEEFVLWVRARPAVKLIFLDIKVPEEYADLTEQMVRSIESTLARYPIGARIVYETLYPRVADEIRRVAPDRAVTLDIEAPAGIVIDPERFSSVGPAIARGHSFATPARPRGGTLAPWTTHRRIVAADVERRDRHNASGPRVPIDGVVSFTVNDEDEIRRLIELGVDGIQSDRPERVMSIALALNRRLA